MSDMAVCSICGKEYRACLSCKEKMKIMPWKRLTDTEECYKIFLTVQSYTNKNTTKEEARSALEKVKFNKEELKPHIQAAIDEIFAKVPEEEVSPKEEVPEGDKSPNEDKSSKDADKSLEEEKVPDGENKVANKPQQSQVEQSQVTQPQKQQTQATRQAQPKKSSKYYKKGKKR